MRKQSCFINYAVPFPAKHCVFFTSNQVVKANGELVMGAGNAKAARDAIPHAASCMGRECKANPPDSLLYCAQGDGVLGAFPTKRHFKDPSPLELVKSSLAQLHAKATEHPDWWFHLPMPAVNHGGLSPEVVIPLVEALPDNVYVYWQGW